MQLRKKTKKVSASAQNINLSIQFSLDGFSFCITNSETSTILQYTEYTYEKRVLSPELLLEKIIYLFENDGDLQQNFTGVFAIHTNQLACVVPEELFDRNNLEPYLKYTIKTLPTDFITYDYVGKMNANTVYIPYVNINNFLFQNFGEFEYKHQTTVLIEKLSSYVLDLIHETCFFVHVNTSFLDIIVFRNQKLIFHNSFSYTTEEDFVYYILFVAEQLRLDPNSFQLTFLGTIDKESNLYKITYDYVRNINFIRSSSKFFEPNDTIKNHSTYLLLS